MSYMSLGKELKKNPEITLEEASAVISKDYSKILSSLSEQLGKCKERKGINILRDLKNKKYPITEEDSN